MKLANDFKAFILRGNVIDLAVAVVIGVAFTAVVTAMVEDLLTPLIAAVFGQPDFSGLTFTINGSTFLYGDFINKLFSFLTIAATVFFFVITPINAMVSRSRREPPVDPTTMTCPECLSTIPLGARRCMHCTAELAPASVA